jgi:hypothetical protein
MKTMIIVGSLAAIVALVLVYGSRRSQSSTARMHANLAAARLPSTRHRFGLDELIGLPAPVRKYFLAVLTDGQPIVSAADIALSGTINMSETGEKWKRFTSRQQVIAQRPGFDWEGRIEMMPGLTVQVHDAYIAGEGILHATLFGLVSLANLRGTPDIAHGELLRFLAESAWYPTALLPSQGVHWTEVDAVSAKATLKDGNTSVELLFRFDQDGLIESAYASARGRTVAGVIVPTPWEGRWSNYERHDGMLIPAEGEVAWQLPDGWKSYFRGRITSVRYEFAR